MAEFLWRGWNVAIPEVDIGDDLFVVQDEEAHLYRIQVRQLPARNSNGVATLRSFGSAWINCGPQGPPNPTMFWRHDGKALGIRFSSYDKTNYAIFTS